MSQPEADPRAFLTRLFEAAVARAHPSTAMQGLARPEVAGEIIVLGAGKAGAAMASALEAAWGAEGMRGLVVTRYGHGCPVSNIEIVEAGHPMPDDAGAAAAARMLDMASAADADDLVVFLASGGASSLLAAPAAGVPLADKQAVTRALLKSGATIHQMNAVRKHLSAIKGGRLAAAAAPARVLTLAISDVPGDDPDVIGSGPTTPDFSSLADARAVLETFGIEAPKSIVERLADPAAETPKHSDPIFGATEFQMLATPLQALEAAAAAAPIAPHILSDRIEGEARDVAKVHGAIARHVADHGQPFAPPALLLSGGETTVTVRGGGRGGRNVEFLLALAIELDGLPGVHAIACDTDGIDGSEDNAGAVIGPDTLARAQALGIDVKARLADNDGYSVFEALGDLIVTGPTLTNVNDFRAILALPGSRAGA